MVLGAKRSVAYSKEIEMPLASSETSRLRSNFAASLWTSIVANLVQLTANCGSGMFSNENIT
jgi:hypothetical protein